MEFGSEFVYAYSGDSEEECVSDDEYNEGMTTSYLTNDEAGGEVSEPNPKSTEKRKSAGRRLLDALPSWGQSASSSSGTTAPKAPEKQAKKSHHWLISRENVSSDGALTYAKKEEKTKALSLDAELPAPADILMDSEPAQAHAPIPLVLPLRSLESVAHCAPILPRQLSVRGPGGAGGSARAVPAFHGQAQQQAPKGKNWRRADTNVIAIKFDALISPSHMHTGDPVVCTHCQAILSHLSKLTPAGEGDMSGKKIWNCEYCKTRNEVDVMPEEVPSEGDVTFMLEPALSTVSSGKQGMDESFLVFCVDVSGSMCVTTEVDGTLRVRGDHTDSLRSQYHENSGTQFLPQQRRNVTYISRLQAVQAAVDHQLAQMAKDYPHRRVALVTFSSEVHVIGDGSSLAVNIYGDKLGNYEELVDTASLLAQPQAIKFSRETLGKKIYELEEGGQTALGPALLVSIIMAKKAQGSKVVICTDGMANVGVGSLDCAGDEDYQRASEFYASAGSLAAQSGVTISVVTIRGTDCKLVELGKVADATGGQVNIVDPMKLPQEFGSVLEESIIATQVTATLLLHRNLYVRNEVGEENKIVRNVGNVTRGTEITFEYGVRREPKPKKRQQQPPSLVEEKEGEEKMDTLETKFSENNPDAPSCSSGTPAPDTGVDESEGSRAVPSTSSAVQVEKDSEVHASPSLLSVDKQLPFQLQIRYTDLDGAKALRLITQSKRVTTDRSEAERNIKAPVVAACATQISSKFALDGQYGRSRLHTFMYQRLLHRNRSLSDETSSCYGGYLQAVAPMNQNLNQLQVMERAARPSRQTNSDSDEDCDEAAEESKSDKKKKAWGHGRKKAMSVAHQTERSRICSDDVAAGLYSNRRLTSTNMFKK